MVAERNGRKFTFCSVCDQEKGVAALYNLFTHTKRHEFKSTNKAKVSVRAKQAIVII